MSTNRTEDNNQSQNQGLNAVKSYVLTHKIDAALWVTRAITIFFSFSFMIPLFSTSYNAYYKALMSNAATSALRLNQRIPNIEFSRQFLYSLTLEDSAHYLMYSLIFMHSHSPLGLVLIPIFLFALLHFASFSLGILDLMGRNNATISRYVIDFIELQQRNLLRGAAIVEILLMPCVAVYLFMGHVAIVTPFFYYKFLKMRYASQRNSYTRTVFYELRLSVEAFAWNPWVPQLLRNFLYKCITFVSALAPPITPSQ